MAVLFIYRDMSCSIDAWTCFGLNGGDAVSL